VNWARDHVPPSWKPGTGRGRRRRHRDVLFGDYNPAGRLPVTFYRSPINCPPSRLPHGGRTYRYFTASALSFGYGLSYTNFAYRNLRLPSEARPATRSRCRWRFRTRARRRARKWWSLREARWRRRASALIRSKLCARVVAAGETRVVNSRWRPGSFPPSKRRGSPRRAGTLVISAGARSPVSRVRLALDHWRGHGSLRITGDAKAVE